MTALLVGLWFVIVSLELGYPNVQVYINIKRVMFRYTVLSFLYSNTNLVLGAIFAPVNW